MIGRLAVVALAICGLASGAPGAEPEADVTRWTIARMKVPKR